MNQYWLKFNEWWSQLALRERRFLLIGGIVVSVAIIYQFMWSASINTVANLRQQIQTQQKLLTWMGVADKTLQQFNVNVSQNTEVLSPVLLLNHLQTYINQAHLDGELVQLKQSANNAVMMQFQKVEFDKLIALLTLIAKEQPIVISQFTAIADNTPGIVNAEVVIGISYGLLCGSIFFRMF